MSGLATVESSIVLSEGSQKTLLISAVGTVSVRKCVIRHVDGRSKQVLHLRIFQSPS